MARVTHAKATRQRKKRTLKAAKGFRGNRSKRYMTAQRTVDKARVYATRDRHVRKREFRELWINRINIACHQRGLTYSRLMHGLRLAKVQLNRKMLAAMAVNDQLAFDGLVGLAKSQLQ